jgi:hypothetical protein
MLLWDVTGRYSYSCVAILQLIGGKKTLYKARALLETNWMSEWWDLQELVYLIVIAELSIALLMMFDPVETDILKFRGKMLFFLTSLNVGRKHIRNA